MNYKGIVSRAIASSPKLKKNFCPPLFTVRNTGILPTICKRTNLLCKPCTYHCLPLRGRSTASIPELLPMATCASHVHFSGVGYPVLRVPQRGKRMHEAAYLYPLRTKYSFHTVGKMPPASLPTDAPCCASSIPTVGIAPGYAKHRDMLCFFHTYGRNRTGLVTVRSSGMQRYGNFTKLFLPLRGKCEAKSERNSSYGIARGIAADQINTQFSGVSSCKARPPVQEVEGYTKQAQEAHQNTTDSLWDQKRPTYPFTAIVGQEEMKLALLLNVIDPKIGGVMIMGDRGTGKSTTVRALIDLLPTIEVVDNDPFNSHPSDAELMSQNVREQVLQGKSLKVIKKKTQMIDLPLGATEDRVCGTIDIERALSEGVKAFEPGLLAKANRGILYVDEVNLLDDHLVDILLDSAASGWNTVEREGISISHPARFILVGSGNPEEGELRPQLLDRFGMHAQIGTVREAELRVKIVEERADFDRSPIDFLALHIEKQKELADKIVAARHLLGAIKIDYDLRVKISQVCGQLNVDGLRGDIVTNRASQALAAFEARTSVTPQDIFRVIPLCLRHRLRKDPLEPIDSGNRVREVFKQVFGFMSE